jgi:glycosyltransferase involved in cell wall biosynthesis
VGVGLRPEAYPARDKGLCRARLGLPPDAFVVLFLGRQVEYKGLGTALSAIVSLRREHPQILYLVVGPDTEYSSRLFAQSADRSVVVSLGMVPDDTRLDALGACDCLVLPSGGEAFGIAFLEAWIMGKPVIGPQMPAVTSLISEGHDGWLVPIGDPVAIANALRRWVRDPALARQMGDNGRRKVLERYTCARVAESVEAAYLRALSTHGRAQAAGKSPLDA